MVVRTKHSLKEEIDDLHLENQSLKSKNKQFQKKIDDIFKEFENRFCVTMQFSDNECWVSGIRCSLEDWNELKEKILKEEK